MLDRDFLTIPEAEIPQTQVLMTVVGGKTVHLGADLAREIGMQPVGPSTWTEPIPEGWEAEGLLNLAEAFIDTTFAATKKGGFGMGPAQDA